MKLTISNIDWDYDGKDSGEPLPEGLPTEVVITDEDLLNTLLVDIDGYSEEITDYLSDTYGYCVCGYTTDVEGVDKP